MNILNLVKGILSFVYNPKLYIKQMWQIYNNFKYLLHNLNKIMIVIFTIIICFYLLIILPPSRMTIKSYGLDQTQRQKAYISNTIQPLIPNSILLLANLNCLPDIECIITIEDNIKDLTLEENQTINTNKRHPLQISANTHEYNFLYSLFNFQSPSKVCKTLDIKDTFSCRRDILHINADINSQASGYFKELHDQIFGFEKTKDLLSIAFHIAEPLDKLTAHYNRSLLIILNHNDFADLKNPDLEKALNNRIIENRDSESSDYINSKQKIFSINTIKYKVKELIAKYYVLFNIMHPVNRH